MFTLTGESLDLCAALIILFTLETYFSHFSCQPVITTINKIFFLDMLLYIEMKFQSQNSQRVFSKLLYLEILKQSFSYNLTL